MGAIMTAVKMQDEEIQTLGLEILAETPVLAYPHLRDQIEEIGSLTAGFCKSQEIQPLKRCLSFWIALSQEERKHTASGQVGLYIGNYIGNLLQIALNSFIFEEDDKEDQEKWLVYIAAGELLGELAKICGDTIWNQTFQFFIELFSTN